MAELADVDVNASMDDRWEFNEEVARVFDEMLARSIPQYQAMRDTVFRLGSRFVRPGTIVLDLGCSRGEALAPFVQAFADTASFVGCEVSPPMVAACRDRFSTDVAAGRVSIVELDLRERFPIVGGASVVLSVLTLQFVPVNYRQQILARAYDALVPGGALLLVEKVLGSSAPIDQLMVDEYHADKRRAGYTEEEVERKRLSLEGVLVPLTARWNEEILAGAGFREVDCFWRWMNFAGWLALKA